MHLLIFFARALVARLHGVETIREFVSGAAVTLILDLPFLLIFLVVMFAYSWQLSLIAVGLLGLISILSFLVAPVFRELLPGKGLAGKSSLPPGTTWRCCRPTRTALVTL